jgi:hypothetical protein
MKAQILIVFGTFCAHFAFAQTTTTKPSGELSEKFHQGRVEDPNVITDKKLQADEGSFSKYSLKFSLGYSGPGIGDLSNPNQPNPDGVISSNQTKMTGSMSARYRFSGVSAMSFGTGVSAIHPLHGWDRTDINSPFLSYDRSSRFGDLQVRNIVSVSQVTTPEYLDVGEKGTASYEVDLVQNIGTSPFAIGLDTRYEYFYYDRPYVAKTDKSAAQYYFNLFPNMKYQVSDKLNFNTSYALMWYNARSVQDRYALWNRTVTQRIGMGYSFRRDIYLSPYLTVYPNNMKTENTTFNLSAAFSVL